MGPNGVSLFLPEEARADEDNVADVVMVVNRQEIVEVPYALGNIIWVERGSVFGPFTLRSNS